MSRVIAYTVMLAYFGTLAVIAVHELRHVFAAIAQGLNQVAVQNWPTFSCTANNAACNVYVTTWTFPDNNAGAAGACVPRIPLPPMNNGGAAIALPVFTVQSLGAA